MNEEIVYIKLAIASLKGIKGWFIKGRRELIRDYEQRLAILEAGDKIIQLQQRMKDPVLRRRALR